MLLPPEETPLGLARTLFALGGVVFGNFTLGRSTVNSPVYINPRLLISAPAALQQVARLIEREVQAGLARRRPRVHPFDLVCGVPYGGLHLATAYALQTGTPMIYARTAAPPEKGHVIEGRYQPGQTVLIIDDLITSGTSILQTAAILAEQGLVVRDAIVLVDREQGGAERLRQHGIHLVSLLTLRQMLTYYYNEGLIPSEWYYRSLNYLERYRSEPPEAAASSS